MDKIPSIEPMSWLLGIIGTITTGWVAITNRKVNEHSVRIAVVETDVRYIKEGIDDIKIHLGIKPKE